MFTSHEVFGGSDIIAYSLEPPHVLAAVFTEGDRVSCQVRKNGMMTIYQTIAMKALWRRFGHAFNTALRRAIPE